MESHSHHYVHAQQSVSPTDYYSGHGLALTSSAALPAQAVQPGPRSYKSRKYRPCDFCRARQVACKIDESPPCNLCSAHGRECTFLERPKKKRRPNASSIGSGEAASASNQHFDVSATPLSPGFIAQFNQEQSYNGLSGHDPALSSPDQLQSNHNDASPIFNMDPYLLSGGIRIAPLDSRTSRSARFIGETGESTPYLLKYCKYDTNDECTISKLTYRRIQRSMNHDSLSSERYEPPVVFMLADDSLAQKAEPRAEEHVLQKARKDIEGMFTEQEALRLIGLFLRYVYPYFPILSKSELCPNGPVLPSVLQTLPFSLLSAIYASSLPFMLYDDLLSTTLIHSPPPAHQLFRITWLYIMQELHTPRLATLQACLLLLQRAPTNRYTTDTPWKMSLVGWTVSLAHSLGLQRECCGWSSIPTWEMNLRKRLFYAVFIMDKWASLGAGMPSHIKTDDFDVLPLLDSDLEPPSLDPNSTAVPGFLEPDADSNHFRLLVELTIILSDIMGSYYTIRATQRTSKNFNLSLDLARSLRKSLTDWKDSLPPALAMRQSGRFDSRVDTRISGNPSLSLANIVATMTLFRALLRPLENLSSAEEQDRSIVDGRLAVRAGAKECAKEVVEFVENLGRGSLDAFWHSWSRANFAIASSFLMQLLVTSQNDVETNEIDGLVARWRWAMRIGSGSTGNGLMSLGLIRLDGLLLENGTTHPAAG
ncbi:related to DAL81-transcriptional activator for allantoin and GABA catabolic genes [Rhynchosporium agropyri]|uniref:Related to DAL81-transcriptional activator for allantoin and GABA catabolic genes n=1 Tax=Rhynchosporium agropyri TaxID=914238 RepID=A0A1E1JSS4_9HELO|nr:related to DAL81-transcriptional activator for allantoin and GABA catabolic genes [Rhynchosporium agropyri]